MSSNMKVISLFSGCGGADLGVLGDFRFLNKKYVKLDTEIIHASDIDVKAVKTYNANFEFPAVAKDIADVTFPAGFGDLILGGFPCQSFSTVNPNKNPDDARGQLFHQLARIIDEVQPYAFVAENVQGFYRLSGGKYFQLAVDRFRECGYQISHAVINSADFGVPQLRKRLFIIGLRSDLDCAFSFPEPTHSSAGIAGRPWVPISKVVKSVIPENPKYYFSQKAIDGVKRSKNNMKRALAQDLNAPSLTITSHLAKVSINSRDPVLLVDASREKFRRFTPREAASIQSFPNSFKFVGSDADAYRQIGNAIPPVVMWHLTNRLINLLQSRIPGESAA